MKRVITAVAACLVTAFSASASELDLRNTTYGIFRQIDTPGFKKEFNAIGLDYLKIDLTNIGNAPVDFHFYGWGGVEKAGGGNTDGDMSYAYLAYRFPKANGLIKGGRFYLFEGIAMEQIDGVSVGADLAGGFAASSFVGQPVRYKGDTKGDLIYGGKLAWRYPKIFTVSVSALREENTPYGFIEGNDDFGGDSYRLAREKMSWDFWLSPHSAIEFIGNVSHGTRTGGLSDAKLLVNFRPAKAVTFSGEFNEYRLSEYFAGATRLPNNDPLIFSEGEDGERVRRLGASVDWRIVKPLTLTALYRHIDYTGRGGTDRFGTILKLTGAGGWGSLQYARLDGSEDNRSYHQFYAAVGATGKTVEGSASLLYQMYDEEIYGKKEELEAVAYLGFKLAAGLVLSGELRFGQGPRYDNDLRGIVRLSYTLLAASKGAAK